MNFIISWKNLEFPFINTVYFMIIGFGKLVTNFLVSLSIHSLFCSPFTYYGHAELPFCSHSYDRDQIAEKLEIDAGDKKIKCFSPGTFCLARGCNMAWRKKMLRWVRR